MPSARLACAPRSPSPPRLRASCGCSGACTRERRVPPQSTSGIFENPCTTSRSLFALVALILNARLVSTAFCPAGTEVIGTRSKTPCFSRLVISLFDAVFQHAGVQDAVRLSPSRTARLSIGQGVGNFSSSSLSIKLMPSTRRVYVGVEI